MHLCQIALIDPKAIKSVRASYFQVQLYVITDQLPSVPYVCKYYYHDIALMMSLFIRRSCYRLFLSKP